MKYRLGTIPNERRWMMFILQQRGKMKHWRYIGRPGDMTDLWTMINVGWRDYS